MDGFELENSFTENEIIPFYLKKCFLLKKSPLIELFNVKRF